MLVSHDGVEVFHVHIVYICVYTFFLQAADAKYAKATAKAGPSQKVIFERDKIMLDIAVEGVVLENGWTITPYTHPGVSLHYNSDQLVNFNIIISSADH